MVHSIAFAQAHDLQGRYIDTAREDFLLALDVSCYSLTAMARRAEPLMQERGGGSIVTLTYLGGERAVPRYNVMGVAKAALDASVRYLASDLGPSNVCVNAVSAGPVRTLAARSIPGFTTMEEIVAGALAAEAQHRRVRRGGRRGVPARRAERHGHDGLRRRRLPRDGDVACSSRATSRGSSRTDDSGRPPGGGRSAACSSP